MDQWVQWVNAFSKNQMNKSRVTSHVRMLFGLRAIRMEFLKLARLFLPLGWSVQGISGFPAGRLVGETINMDAPGWMMFIKCLGQLLVSRFGCWLVFWGNNSGIRLRGWICIYSGFILFYDKTVMISILNYYEPCSCFLSSCVASWMWWLIFCHQTMLVYIYISFYSLPKYCVRLWLTPISEWYTANGGVTFLVLKPENLAPWAFLRHRTMVLSWLSSFPERCAALWRRHGGTAISAMSMTWGGAQRGNQ